jgi:hypothetical protein
LLRSLCAGLLYLQINTVARPQGDVRGQISAPDA